MSKVPKIKLDNEKEEKWYDKLDESAEGKESIDIKKAESLWLTEVSAWEAEKKKHENGDDRYIQQVIKSGTLSDKVAAMTLMVQESPVHRVSTLENLLAMSKSGKHAAKMAMESLKELFTTSILPTNRKLERYRGLKSSEDIAILAYFEHRIKAIYNEYINAIEASTKHQAIEIRKFGIETAAFLLSSRPEEEARLLAIVVNKLGDREGQAQAAAHACLKRLLSAHRAMTPIVSREVQALAARPNLDQSSQYAALNFLSQIYLDKDHLSPVADSLIDMYIRFFRTKVQLDLPLEKNASSGLISSDDPKIKQQQKKKTQSKKTKQVLATKLLALLLTGLKRALPYCSKDATTVISKGEKSGENGLDALFRLSHTGTLSSRVQSLCILEKLLEEKNDEKLEARFFRSLYDLLLTPELRRTGKLSLALNLCFTTLSKDTDARRAAACLKRLIQATAHASPATCAAAIYLAANVRRRNQALNTVLDTAATTPVSEIELSNFLENTLLKRDPRHVDTMDNRMWEVQTLSHHYHPSASIFCRNFLLRDTALNRYKGDPLQDFALANFFDRFAYRNPKNEKKMDHSKPTSRLSNNSSLFDSYDFYAKYLQEAKTNLPVDNDTSIELTSTRNEANDEDDDDDDDILMNEFSADSDEEDDIEMEDEDSEASDDDDDDLGDLVTPLAGDDDSSEDDEPSGIPTKRKSLAASLSSGKRKSVKSSPFVDADEYMAELERKQLKMQEKEEARKQRRRAREEAEASASSTKKEKRKSNSSEEEDEDRNGSSSMKKKKRKKSLES